MPNTYQGALTGQQIDAIPGQIEELDGRLDYIEEGLPASINFENPLISKQTLEQRIEDYQGQSLNATETFVMRKSKKPSSSAKITSIKGNTIKYNQWVEYSYPSGDEQYYDGHKAAIMGLIGGNKYYTKIGGVESIITAEDMQSINVDGYPDMVIDLTIMFGEGNEPETVAEANTLFIENFGARKWYPYDINLYDGKLVSCKTVGFTSTGFNQWDEVVEVGGINTSNGQNNSYSNLRTAHYIPVLPDTDYYIHVPNSENGTITYFYTYNKNMNSYEYISYWSLTTFKTPINCTHIRIQFDGDYGTTYNNDICVNISEAGKNGTYEAYKHSQVNFDITALKYGSTTIFADGLKRVGDVADEIIFSDKEVTAIKRIGSRAYTSSDASEENVIYDAETTYYVLATPVTYTEVSNSNGFVTQPSIPSGYIESTIVPDNTAQLSHLSDGYIMVAPTLTVVYEDDVKLSEESIEDRYITESDMNSILLEIQAALNAVLAGGALVGGKSSNHKSYFFTPAVNMTNILGKKGIPSTSNESNQLVDTNTFKGNTATSLPAGAFADNTFYNLLNGTPLSLLDLTVNTAPTNNEVGTVVVFVTDSSGCTLGASTGSLWMGDIPTLEASTPYMLIMYQRMYSITKINVNSNS